MSKKNRPVEVAIDEDNRDGKDVLVIKVKEKEVGVVTPTDDGGFAAKLFDDRPIRVKTQNEAVELLLSNYNLHH
ncbi:DUF2969 family protein [Secundilactobacillus kimchicus]|uniref:DUF2969 domain-containing protein n=1 Tax=Secundilactobacillus kimchicus JCM 15530 TaxID=1302272 RepID=A0A0R1HXU0_9LACO|nr:DUF2969 family protein [Secundilactobacillus kimchicus]KRK48234.1 hypothetical protein FC96_GL001973 [Secundilactobacillus kimchicus JCM 15530]MBT9670805.1 DUF2969 family protein [Secundilactobacillus kimchicus]